MTSAFDCTNCSHPNYRHTVKKWPQIALACAECDCPGYQPNYKKSRWDEDIEAGAIG